MPLKDDQSSSENENDKILCARHNRGVKKYLIILGALMASLASPHAFGVESVSREASAPVIYYEGDIETSASAPEGSLVTVYTCFSKESRPFLNSICPEKPFEERFS